MYTYKTTPTSKWDLILKLCILKYTMYGYACIAGTALVDCLVKVSSLYDLVT